jgi:TRAP-type transport system periplasmic protein
MEEYMKFLKSVFALTLGLVLIAGVFAAGRQSYGGTSDGTVAKIKVTFAGTEAATTGQSRAMQEMADLLNASGRFDADVQVNGALSNNTDDMVTQAKTGIPLVVPRIPDASPASSIFQI